MARTKYTYSVEVRMESTGRWHAIIKGETRDFCTGYILAMRDAPPPRLAHRMVRSDGQVTRQGEYDERVGIGMIAGMPSPEQYEAAAKRALEQAAHLRMYEYQCNARTLARIAAKENKQ